MNKTRILVFSILILIPFEMMIYSWRKHGICDNPAQIHICNLRLDFWKRNLN